MPPSKKVQGAVKRPTLVKKGKKDAIKRDKVKIRDNESTTLLEKKHLANDVPKSNLKTEKIVPAIAPKCTPSKASKKEFYVEQVDINLSNNRSHNTRSQKLFDKPTKKRNSSVDIPSKNKKRKLERTTPHSYKQYDNESVLSEMSHAAMFAQECETSPKQNSSELFCFEEDQAQLTQFNINNSSPLKIEIPSDYSSLVFSANTSTNLSSPSTSDIKSSPSKSRQRSRIIRNNSQSSDRSSESTGRTRKFFPRISKELSTSKESLVSSKSSYSNVKPECSNSDIDDGLISDISLNDSISLNRSMISSPYVQVQVMSDELLHHWSKTTENMSSCASLKGKVSNVNSSPSLVNTTKPTTKQPLSIKNKIGIVESSLPTTKKCLVTSKKYVITSSPEQSTTIENKKIYSPSFDILKESWMPDQHKVGRGNSLSNICMPSSPTRNNAKLSLSQCTKSETQVDSKKVVTHSHDAIGDKEIGKSLQRGSRRHLRESSSDSRINMSRDIDEVESVSKMSSEAQVDSKKVVTHSHDVIDNKEIGDSLRRRSRRHLSESSSDSRLSMSRDIDEVESVSKMASEAQVDSKTVVTHSHNVIEDKEIGDSLWRILRRHLSESSSDSRLSMSRDIDEVESISKMSYEVDSKTVVTHSHDVIDDKEIGDSPRRRSRRHLSESSSDSKISMSRDIDEVKSVSKISSQVSPTKQKITHKLNSPYQQINLNVAEVKHLDFNQIALCNTPESISNNSSTTSKINAPNILKDDEEKQFCPETDTNSYKSLHLVSTYNSDKVNTTMPAQKQTVVLKVLQTPASQNAVGETPSSVCEDISLKLSKSAEALGSDQATSKQNLVQVEGHKVVLSDNKTPVIIKSSPQCTSSLDCNSRATAPTSNKRFRLKRNFSSNLSKSNTVQTSSDMYPIEQEKLCLQKTTEKLIPSVQLISSQNTLEKNISKEIPDYSSLSTEDASLQISKNKVTVNSFVNKVSTKTSSEEAKHTNKLIAEMTSKKISKNNLPSTKPSLTEEFCEDLSSQNNSSRINVKRKKYGTLFSTYKATSKDTSTGSLVELVSHSENFPTQLKSNTEVTKTPKPILKDDSTKWAQEIIPENLVSKEKDFNSLKNIGRLTKKLTTPNIPLKKLVTNSFNSRPHLPETCLPKSTSITQITASETLKSSSTFHKKIIPSNILTSNSIDSNEPSSSLVGRNKKKPLKNSANNSSKQVDVFSPQLERSSKTSSSNPTKPVEPFSTPFERPPKASPINPTRPNEPCSSALERLPKTLSHSSTKPVGHFSPPFKMSPKISPSNPPKIVEQFSPKVERPPKSPLSNLTKPFEQFSAPLKRPPITLSNLSKPTKLVSSKFVQHQSLPRMSSNNTTKLSTRPTTSNFKPSKPALNNCIRSSKPSWPDNNTIFKHPNNSSNFKKVSHSYLGQSPSTPTSMSDPAVSGHLRNEDNESDEDLDAISLFAETDIGFEQRPVEVRPKNIHPDNPFAKSDSDSDISNNSDNESRPLELPVPEFLNYLNTEKESHQTVTNIPLNDEVDSNEDLPRWHNDNDQECDQSSGNENDGSECSVEVPFGEELDSHNMPSLTAEDRFDTYDDAHSMAEEREFETENENKYFAEEEDNLEDLRYNDTANIDSPNLPDKAAEQHCETNIAHSMSGYLMQHGNTEDVTPMGYHSPSQHSSSSCRKPQEGKFCFTFLKHGNCKKYPHNCTYNHCVPHHSLSAPIEAGNYLSFTYSKGFNHASNFVLTSLIKEIIDKNETNINRNDQELWDILVKMLIRCGKPVVSLLNTLINTFVSIISDLPLKSFDSAMSLLLVVAKYNALHSTWSSVKSLIWATDLKGTVDVVTKYINVCNTLSTPDKEFIVDVYKYFIELNPAIKNCEDISVRKFASVLQKNGLTHFANNLKIVAPKAFGLKPSEHKPGPSFTATIKKCDESQQNSLGFMSGLMETGPHLPQERRSNVLLPRAKVPIPPKRLNNTLIVSSESINNTFVKPDSQVPNTFSDMDLRNKLQISHNSSASSQECSPQEKLTSVRAELSTHHSNRNMNMRHVTRRGEQPSPLDSIPDQTDYILHSQNITRVPKLNNSNPHNVHLSNANISSNNTFQKRSSDVLDYAADTMSSYVHNNEEGFNEPLSYTDNINRNFYSISSTKHPIGNTTLGPKLFCPPGIRAGFNIRDPGGKYWESEGYSTHASSLPLPDSSREIFQDMAQLSNFSTQRPFEFQGNYGPNFQCLQRPQLPPQLLSNKPPQGPKLHRVRRRRQSQTQRHLIHELPNRNCGPVNEDECRMVFEQEWNLTLKNLKGGDYRSVSARLNNWKNKAERNEFCARVYQELIRNGESAAPNFRRLVESAGNPHLFSNRRDFQK